MTLLGSHLADAQSSQNTTLCLFEPGADGLSADSFPTEDSVYFGTRPGRRRLFLPSLAELTTAQIVELVAEQRRAETGEEPDPAIVERMAWEYQHVTDGYGLAQVMDELAARHPARSTDEPPLLPVFPDLGQALNIAAADTRAVIVLVPPAEGGDALELALRRAVFEPGIAGRSHVARLAPEAWARAHDIAQVRGGELEAGVFLVAPDPFGLDGEVWHEVRADADDETLRRELRTALDRFRAEWRKLDRKTHIATGVERGITWAEWDPDTREVRPIEAGSKKLGAGYREGHSLARDPEDAALADSREP